MQITLEQIREYNQCPMIYKYKNQLHIERGLSNVRKGTEKEMLYRFREAVRKSILFFYYQITQGTIPEKEDITNKFVKIMMELNNANDVMSLKTQDKVNKSDNQSYLSQGIATIEKFYNRETNKRFTPIIADHTFPVNIGNHTVVCTLDLVREMYDNLLGEKYIEIVSLLTTNNDVDPFFATHNTTVTLNSYGFRQMFEAKEDRIVLEHIKTGKIYATLRTASEFRRLEAIVDSVCNAIENNIFYPVHNTQCNTCHYKDVCDKYKF